jgi:hypothetical protein
MGARSVVALAVATCIVASAPARTTNAQPRSEPPDEVELILPDCPRAGLDFSSVLTALVLELDHDRMIGVVARPPPHPEARASIEISLVCSAQVSEVAIHVRSGDVRVNRSMTVSDLPQPVRARAVSLVAAEVMRSGRSRTTLDETKTAPSLARPMPQAAQTTETTPPPATGPADRTAKKPPQPANAERNAETRRSPVELGVGPALRLFLPATTPAWGGRASVRIGRLRVGSDIVLSHVPDVFGSVALGVAVIWSEWELLSSRSSILGATLGPRLGVGAAWSPTHAWVAEASSATATEVPSRPIAVPLSEGRTRAYVEGMLATDLLVQLGHGWKFGSAFEPGVAWGVRTTRETSYGSLNGVSLGRRYPVEAGPTFRAALGASILVAHAL